ncbi:MAG: hypothetical protein Q9191_003243 [Dirinaria sp. TL-2023a]
MPTDGAIAKFLYTILKQLDLKSIDWNEVAGSLDITNGHAARMRFSRFKQQMEGIQPQVRKPKTTTSSNTAPRKKEKQKQSSPSSTKKEKSAKVEGGSESGAVVKQEPGDSAAADAMQGVVVEAAMKASSSPVVKPEPKEEEEFEPRLDLGPGGFFEQQMKDAAHGFGEQHAVGSQYFETHVGEPAAAAFGEVPPHFQPGSAVKEEPFFKAEPVVKLEPYWDE